MSKPNHFVCSVDPIFVISKSTAALNKHWKYCRMNELPYVTVYRRNRYSTVNWDLWSIDVAFLCLNQTTVTELDQYIEFLFARRECVEATMKVTTTGFLKVKRELETQVLQNLWKLINNPENWEVNENWKPSVQWLKKKQEKKNE